MSRLNTLLLMMMAMGMKIPMNFNAKDNTDDNIISPPQSEESKQYYLKRAEEKRLRKLRR